MRKKMIRLAVIFVSCVFFFLGCDCSHDHAHSGHDNQHHHDHDHEHDHEHDHDHDKSENCNSGEKCSDKGESHQHTSQNTIRLSMNIQRAMGLETVKAQKRDVKSIFTCSGVYELLPNARESVATPVAGRLTILVKPLSYVKKGDALFTVTSPELVARSRQIAALERRLDAYRQIKTRNAELENELEVKRAERLALISHSEEKHGVITLVSPVDGLVESFLKQNGEWLGMGDSPVVIVRSHALCFKALVPSGEAAKLKDDLSARVGSFAGKVRLGVGDNTSLVPVYVIFDGDVKALAGMRDEAVIVLSDSKTSALAIPAKSIVSINLKPTVFVRDSKDSEKFLALEVDTFDSSGGWTEVEGLDADAEVVVSGAYELKLALPSGETKSAGHFHADGTFHEAEH
jgi:hypothetical protein